MLQVNLVISAWINRNTQDRLVCQVRTVRYKYYNCNKTNDNETNTA